MPDEPLSDAKPDEPVSDAKPDEPVSDAKPDDPLSDAKPDDPVSDAKPDDPLSDAKPDDPLSDAKPDDPLSDAKPVDPLSDAKIIDSWLKNAEPWTAAVRDDQIESRRLVTNAAIVDAVLSRSPHTALDIGCGEGWLVRALAEHGIQSIGVDVVSDLIARAAYAGGGDFRVASYEDIAAGSLDVEVDVAIANFALLGHEAVDNLVAQVPRLLRPNGAFIIQTLHPAMTVGDHPYADGWREGSWTGFSEDFTDPAPWFFRTIESWFRLLRKSGFDLLELREPVHPITGLPASIIFVAATSG